MKRRKQSAIILAAAAGISVSLVQPLLAAEPIKILALDVLSGPFKDEGEQYIAGVRFAVEEINKSGGINGRPIDLIVDDSQLKPDVAQRKAVKAILDDNVKIIVGATGTAVVKSLAQVASRYKVILAAYSGEADEITGKEFVPEIFRLGLTTTMHAKASILALPENLGKKVYLINQDNAFGHSSADSYKKALDQFRPGWKLVGEDFHPIATKDFAPYLQKIIASDADVIVTSDYAADMTLLHKQAKSFGVKQPFVDLYMSNPVALREIGDAAIGSYTSEVYIVGMDTPANKAFVERWRQSKNPPYQYPDYAVGKAYNVMMYLASGLKKAGSEDHDAIIKAMEGLEYDGLIGKQVVRACDHQVQTPIAVTEVVAGPGQFYKFAAPGKVFILPMEKVSTPPDQTGNPRCAAK